MPSATVKEEMSGVDVIGEVLADRLDRLFMALSRPDGRSQRERDDLKNRLRDIIDDARQFTTDWEIGTSHAKPE